MSASPVSARSSQPAFDRWLPVAGGVSINLALGTLYAWSVFVLPLEQEFGWTRAQTSWVFTIAIAIFAVTFVLAGRIQDRRGPRVCAFVGGMLVSAGFYLASWTTSLWHLYLIFGVVGLGNGFGYATPIPVASKWFPDRRGLVVGIMVAGYGAGSAVFGPVATSLIDRVGWRETFAILGAVFFVMTMAGTWLIRNPPVGYRAPTGASTVTVSARITGDFATREMLGTTTFYAMWIAYCLGATAGLMTISQLVPFARSAGMGTAAATLAITIGAIGNAAGRILSGWLSDRFGRLTTLTVMILVSALAMPLLFTWRQQLVPFYLLVGIVYWCYGTQLSVFASATADFYGTRYLGMNYGTLFTAWGAAGILGPFIGGRIFDRFRDYRFAFYIAAVLAVMAAVSLLFAKAPARAPEGAAPSLSGS